MNKLKTLGLFISLFFLAIVFYFTMFLTTLFLKIEMLMLRRTNANNRPNN